MGQVTYTCTGCSATFVQDEDYLIEGLYDPDHPESFDSTQHPLSLDTVCSSCCQRMEERFSRPAHATGRRTLGDELAGIYDIHVLGAFREAMTPEPEVAEIFPGLSDSRIRPRKLRIFHSEADMVDALARVGRDVCITFRLEEEEEGDTDLVLLFAGLNECGAPGFGLGSPLDEFDLALKEGWVNGHDYDPDGYPLAIE